MDFLLLSACAALMADIAWTCFFRALLFSWVVCSVSFIALVWSCRLFFCVERFLLSASQVWRVRMDWLYRESYWLACCCMALNFPVLTQLTQANTAAGKITRYGRSDCINGIKSGTKI